MSASDFSAAFATTPFRHHLSSTGYLTTSCKFGFKLQRHFSGGETRRSVQGVEIAALWPNTDSAVSPPSSPGESNGALEVNAAVDKSYSFLKCDGSKTVHAAERLGRGIVTDAITTPVVNTSVYFFKKTADLIDWKEKRQFSYEYGRYGNPTTAVLEEKMSVLEGAESTLFLASGMCTSSVMFLALVPAGGHIITTTDCYRRTRIFIANMLPKMGITATIIDPADVDALEAALENNKVSLFFTETPTNPFQRSLSLGADLVVNSATKYIAGHHDVLAGCISGSEKLISQVRSFHFILGGTLSPSSAYLVIRGMKTLHLRVQHQNSTALKLAKLLETHPKVKQVYYPGLSSHPEYPLAKRQMSGFGGVVCFDIDGDIMRTIKFVDALKIPYIAPSFGGVESIVNQPAIMSYWDLPRSEREKYRIYDNTVRFCVGVEGYQDLKDDILQALEVI
ncbi:hypothetical protein RYX36_008704 [Vicia faba]